MADEGYEVPGDTGTTDGDRSPEASVTHMSSTASAFLPIPSIELDLEDTEGPAPGALDSSLAEGIGLTANADATTAFFGWDSGGESQDDAEQTHKEAAEGNCSSLRGGFREASGLAGGTNFRTETARLWTEPLLPGSPLPSCSRWHAASSREYSFERLGPSKSMSGPTALKVRPTSARRSPRPSMAPGDVARAAAGPKPVSAGAGAEEVFPAGGPPQPIMRPLGVPSLSPLTGRTFRRSARLATADCSQSPSRTAQRGVPGQRRVASRRHPCAAR
mmetsp:Transcript_113272/g.283727  ORF Transcript_113272/g.283727 Transcript_113272/m.283727 type:complete len:275 (-) Transcript_113272:362-1186(-)